ncbi:MAG: hypothetical protein LRS43_00840 [Desulfurococcales archaeon]|nr:hypothetical protein [Desulfurococcales archaeon]
MANPRDRVVIKIELSYDDYIVLEREARRRGYALVSDYLRDVAASIAREGAGAPPDAGMSQAIESMAKRLERTIVDLINPFTGKIDELAQRIADLAEKIEKGEAEERAEHHAEERGRRRGFTALDRLKSEGVVFEEDMRWLKAPEKFFQRLEREGAIVLNLGGERVAIDREFWERFVSGVEDVKVRDPDHAAVLVEEKMGGKAARLFEKLVRASIAFYDEDLGRWSVPLPQ